MRSKIWTDRIVHDNRFQLIIDVVNAHVRTKLLPIYTVIMNEICDENERRTIFI